MHSFHSRQILPPLKKGFIVPTHKLMNMTLLILAQAALLYSKGSRRPYIVDEDTHTEIRAIGGTEYYSSSLQR